MRPPLTRAWALTLTLTATATWTQPARAWDLFRSQSSAVERGNEALAKGQHQEALEAYDQAARELPNDPAVQLDRGLALMGLDKLGEAREAFRRAGAASAPKDVRGPALYDLGLAFMREADMAGKAEDLDGANKMLQEAIDALRGSLRAQPNNPDAAWNLELAKRRLVDNEQKREQKKKDEEEKKKEQDKDKDKQDQDQNKDQDQQQPDAGSNESGDAGTPKPNDKEGDQGDKNDEQDAGQPEPQPQDGQGDAGQPPPEPQEAKPEPQQPQQQPEANELPDHMKRALDALEAGEENLEKQRARQRARQRPRRIEKDW
ncbi:MAG TPA: tetratricopeptide repeat protein [Polyangiales bacterium]|nr:tetratricopeptide repeat protein [Polyangiales bacterium]